MFTNQLLEILNKKIIPVVDNFSICIFSLFLTILLGIEFTI